MSEWTSEEKTKLLEALKKHGVNKIELVAQELPFKTLSQVNVMIARYERLANYDPEEKFVYDSAIDTWTTIMRQNTDYSELAPICKALKYIGLFEERKEDKVNLRDIYEMLSDISQGLAPKQLDINTGTFLFDTLKTVAKTVKKEDNTHMESFLKSVKLHKPAVQKYSTYQNKTRQGRQLENTRKRGIDDSAVNPLKVPDALLKRRKS